MKITEQTGIAVPIGCTLIIKDEKGTVIYEEQNHETQTTVIYPYDCVPRSLNWDNLTVHTELKIEEY